MLKEVRIFPANFFRSPTSNIVVSSSHQWGVSNWLAHQSQPQFIVLYQWLWLVTLPIPGAPAGHGCLPETFQFRPMGRLRAYLTSLHLSSGQMPLGFPLGPFARGCTFLRLTKGHMSLQSMLAQRPDMPLQRSTPVAAVAAGSSMLNPFCFFAQSFNI